MKQTLDKTHPELIEIWDDEREMSTLTRGSTYRVNVKCQKCSNSWNTVVSTLTKGHRCPVCSGRVVKEGINDLATLHPELSKEVSPESPVLATEVGIGGTKKILWSCKHGHKDWFSTAFNRILGKGCPKCAGRKSILLVDALPELAAQWNDTEDISHFFTGSNYRAEWKCERGHQWVAMINDRTGKEKQGCPYCSGRSVAVGETDLVTTHPHLEKEWNDSRSILTVSAGSNYKANWKCYQCGHLWKTIVGNRARTGHKCPKCARKMSIPEGEVHDFIVSILPDKTEVIRNTREVIPPKELDIYIPEMNIAVEFNGNYWHNDEHLQKKYGISSIDFHKRKKDLAAEKGIALYFVWESDWNTQKDNVSLELTNLFSGKTSVSDTPLLSQLSNDC